jgi:Fanconi anemia group M protein
MLRTLETQGVEALVNYFTRCDENVRKKKGGQNLIDLLESPSIIAIRRLAENLVRDGLLHPKIEALKQVLQEQFTKTPEIRAIVFAQFRDSTTILSKILAGVPGVRPLRFVGQANKGKNDKGISQKEQIRLLQEFKQGTYNVLVATSVAEEGLDISEVDLVVFFEAVPSEIRAIQRRGRTGRKRDGRVVVLVAAKSSDEACLYSERRKEKAMKETIQTLSQFNPSQDTSETEEGEK